MVKARNADTQDFIGGAYISGEFVRRAVSVLEGEVLYFLNSDQPQPKKADVMREGEPLIAVDLVETSAKIFSYKYIKDAYVTSLRL
jgi:hypothetical protein